MDRGLWITWYDLPDAGRADYLAWLHESYIPEIARRPGFLWGAHYAAVADKIPTSRTTSTMDPDVPTGGQYILMFGAEDAQVFGDPVPSEINAGLPVESRKMLALRIAERVHLMAEYGRVDGPEAKNYKPGLLPANCVQLGTYNTPWQNEEELMAYYAQGRLKNMRVLPGCVRTRRLVSVAGWAKHGVVYEFTSLEARNEHFVGHQEHDPKMAAWTKTMGPRLTHAPGSSNLVQRIWPPMS